MRQENLNFFILCAKKLRIPKVFFNGPKRSKSLFEEKNIRLVKKLKALLRGPKCLKVTKTHFWQNLINEIFTQKLFLT
jgi:hypothetical protein